MWHSDEKPDSSVRWKIQARMVKSAIRAFKIVLVLLFIPSVFVWGVEILAKFLELKMERMSIEMFYVSVAYM